MYIYKIVRRLLPKLQTPMEQVILQLKQKGLLLDQIKAIEMFGMHGLWHTMDYVDVVKSMDFFEIDKDYLILSKLNLNKYNVNYYCEDSILNIKNTNNKYNLIIADIPYDGKFYGPDHLPIFWEDIIRITKRDAVIIINIHNKYLKDYSLLRESIIKSTNKEVKDLFFVVRNQLVSYLVVCLG